MAMASELDILRHDTSRAAAMALTDIIIALLRPEEVSIVMTEAFAVVLATLESYDKDRAELVRRDATRPKSLAEALAAILWPGEGREYQGRAELN